MPKPPEPTARTTNRSMPRSAQRRQSVVVSPAKRMEMIARSAYLRAEQRGFTPGAEWEDWFAAEREIDAQLQQAE